MNSLQSDPIARTLDRLHLEAEAADCDLMTQVKADFEAAGASFETLIGEWIAGEKKNYPELYRGHVNHYLSVSPEYGRFLYGIVRMRNARHIVEFGTSMGVSTIYLAAALRDNGGGRLIGAELEPTKVARARAHLKEAGLDDLVEIRQGDALQTLKDVGADVDVAHIDGAWSLYLPVLKLIEPHLVQGAAVLGENAFDKVYTDYVRNPANGYVSVPLPVNEGRGNEFTVRAATPTRTPTVGMPQP